MKADLIERRQKLLSLRGMGISLADAVKELATQFSVSTRAVYLDWSNRKDWLESIIDLKDKDNFFMEILAGHKEIHKRAVAEYLHGDNSASRIGALRLMRDLNKDLFEMVIFRDLAERVEALEESKGGVD